MTKSTAPAFHSIREWVTEINSAKSAAAGEKTPTTHPSKNVDDGTMKPTEGARSAENARDVKQMFPGGAADGAPENKPGTQESQQLQIGTRKSEAGGDPATEDNYKDKPRVTEKTTTTLTQVKADVGEKYSFDLTTLEGLQAALKQAADAANTVAAAVAVSAAQQTQASAQTTSQATQDKAAGSEPASATPAAGEPDLASVLGHTKEAADEIARAVLADTIRQADRDAIKVACHLADTMARERAAAGRTDVQTLNLPKAPAKQAAESLEPEPAPKAPAEVGLKGGAPPEAGPGAGEGAPPPATGGGDGDADADDTGGAGGHEQALQELAMALMELGITPQELASLAQGAGPGAGPGTGGPVPAAPAPGGGEMLPPEAGAKIAAAVSDFRRSGRFKVEEAKTAEQRKWRDDLKGYVLEVVAACRR